MRRSVFAHGFLDSSCGLHLPRTAVRLTGLLLCLTVLPVSSIARAEVEVSGELRLWHKVTLTVDGPETSETAEPNPFRDYRMTVRFHHPDSGTELMVPGYFAADGQAAETSAKSGNKWRAHFSPPKPGTWTYRVSLRQGKDLAVNLDDHAGTPVEGDGTEGQFDVGPSDKTGRDFRAQGRLDYVGEHYLRHAGSKKYFLKGGADSPENFLAYSDFDDTYDTDSRFNEGKSEDGLRIHHYEPHVQDWREGDPTWQGGKGKGILGALNYLASKGMNSVYFLTYNIDGGDGKDVWMWTDPQTRDRYDCSKLDQWEIVFSHMDQLGILLHVITQETENDRKLGGSPGLNPERKLYYRELCARFAHHPAIVWNQGEENNTSDEERLAISAYIRSLDAYDHPITVHTHNNKAPGYYDGLLGLPGFEAASIQSKMQTYHPVAIEMRRRTAEAGRRWAIFGDEQASAQVGVMPDADDPDHDIPRVQALWGNLLGGGSGCEWYFGYSYPHMDLNCEDWRSRDRMWDQTRHALEFFHRYLPFWWMEPLTDATTGDAPARVFAAKDEIYVVQLVEGGTTQLHVGEGKYGVQWYDPRQGGELLTGDVTEIAGPGPQGIGHPPHEQDKDWIALVRRLPLRKR